MPFFGCNNKNTPKEYLYSSIISKTYYNRDTIYLKKLSLCLLEQNIRPFQNKSIFDSQSILILDTIIYSPDAMKMVVFFVIKNSLKKYDRFIKNTNDSKFEGIHFYCIRGSNNEIIVNKDCVFFFSSNSKESLRELFYSYAFERKSTDYPFEGQQQYNLNDCRFWSSKQMIYEMNDSIHLVKFVNGKLQYLKLSPYKSDW